MLSSFKRLMPRERVDATQVRDRRNPGRGLSPIEPGVARTHGCPRPRAPTPLTLNSRCGKTGCDSRSVPGVPSRYPQTLGPSMAVPPRRPRRAKHVNMPHVREWMHLFCRGFCCVPSSYSPRELRTQIRTRILALSWFWSSSTLSV